MAHAVMFTFSRGGLLALILTGGAAFLLIPRRPVHYLALVVAVLIGLQLAGPMVRERFATAFVDEEQRDYSSQERLQLWGVCWDMMQKQPVFGIGPGHFGERVHTEYGYPLGKLAHSLWLQVGAETGFPGFVLLILFYLVCALRLWPLTWESRPVPDPWIRYFARMVIASLVGFAVSAQFVSLTGLELPYYVCMIGAGALKLASVPANAPALYPPPATAYGPFPLAGNPYYLPGPVTR
jgi:O-antigen ligase